MLSGPRARLNRTCLMSKPSTSARGTKRTLRWALLRSASGTKRTYRGVALDVRFCCPAPWGEVGNVMRVLV